MPKERERMARQGRETVLQRHKLSAPPQGDVVDHLQQPHGAAQAPRAGQSLERILERSAKFPELHRRCEAAFRRGEEPGLDGLVSDIVTGKGALTENRAHAALLFHVSKQIIRMKKEEMGDKG